MKHKLHKGIVVSIIWVILSMLHAKAFDRITSSTSSSNDVETALWELTVHLERDCGDCVVRNSNGDLISLKLRGTNVATTILKRVALSQTLEELTLYNDPAASVTREGLAALSAMPKLTRLSIKCNGALPAGIFDELANFTRLRRLALVNAFPASHDYSWVNHLTNVSDLTIFGDKHFGDIQLGEITNSLSLSRLNLKFTGVTKETATALKGSTIPSIVILNPEWKVIKGNAREVSPDKLRIQGP